MKDVWNIARYLGVRESFIKEWQPTGGIEISLIDVLTQAYFQWQFWLEQTVRRSQTREREEDPEYTEWKNHRRGVNKVVAGATVTGSVHTLMSSKLSNMPFRWRIVGIGFSCEPYDN